MRPPCSLAVPPDQARDQAHRAAGRHRTAPLRPSAQTRGPRPAEAHRAHPSKTGARSGRSPARHPGGRSRRFRRACRLFVSVPRSGRRPRFHPFSDHFSPDRAKDGGLWPDPPRPRAPDDEERRRTHVAEGLPCIEASAKRGQLTERVETLNHRQLAAAARAAGGAQVLRQSPLARPPSPEPRLDSSGHHTPRIPSPTSRAVPAITQRSESSIRQRMRAPERRGCLSGARRRTRRVAGSQDPRGIGRSVRW
jgi:hypothetical protein